MWNSPYPKSCSNKYSYIVLYDLWTPNLLWYTQAVILIVVPKMGGSRSLNTKNLLKFVVFFQYLPRFLRIYPLYKEVTRTSGILTETAWAGAAFNLFLYMLASHVSWLNSLVFGFILGNILFFFKKYFCLVDSFYLSFTFLAYCHCKPDLCPYLCFLCLLILFLTITCSCTQIIS